MEREFLTRFLLVTTRFLVVLTTRNEVKNQGGQQRVEKRIYDEVPPCHHEIPHGALHEERGEKTWGGYQSYREDCKDEYDEVISLSFYQKHKKFATRF